VTLVPRGLTQNGLLWERRNPLFIRMGTLILGGKKRGKRGGKGGAPRTILIGGKTTTTTDEKRIAHHSRLSGNNRDANRAGLKKKILIYSSKKGENRIPDQAKRAGNQRPEGGEGPRLPNVGEMKPPPRTGGHG